MTGAVLVVWERWTSAPAPADTMEWSVSWTDGPGHAGSGRYMVEGLLGDGAGGTISESV